MSSRQLALVAAAIGCGALGGSAVAVQWARSTVRDRHGRLMSPDARALQDRVPQDRALEDRALQDLEDRALQNNVRAPVGWRAPSLAEPPRTAPPPASALALRSERDDARPALNEMLGAVAAGQASADLSARIETVLRSDPTAVASALGVARDPTTAKPVIDALGAAGTPAAQAGLLGLGCDAKLPTSVRVDAVAALVLVKRPTAATLDTLARLLDARPYALRQAARASAGFMARAARAEHPTEAAAIEGALLARYRQARRPEDRVAALTALANLGSPAILPPIQSALGNGDPETRAAAARALRLVQGAGADRILIGILRSARDPALRAAAIFAAGFHDLEPLVESLAETAETDPVESVRADSVTLLARYAASPRASRALAYAADNDPTVEVRRLAREALDHRP